MDKHRVTRKGDGIWPESCPHMTAARCDICQRLDAIADRIETGRDLTARDVREMYRVATGLRLPTATRQSQGVLF